MLLQQCGLCSCSLLGPTIKLLPLSVTSIAVVRRLVELKGSNFSGPCQLKNGGRGKVSSVKIGINWPDTLLSCIIVAQGSKWKMVRLLTTYHLEEQVLP